MDAAEQRFLQAFEDCTLPAGRWTHRAHVHMAWLQLQRAPLATALERIRSGILRFNTVVLDRRLRYHDTVTVAFTRLIAAARIDGESFEAFCHRNPALLAKSPPVLERYYSESLLSSEDARRHFVEPDLEPLPEIPG